ncbi:MAG: S49 family peptidase [Burkholderiales bacterium]|nr:S49 family peptidase [Burkholderiales bacterium]
MTTPDDPDSRPAAAGPADVTATGAASAAGAQGQSPGWERAVLEKLALSSLDEKRRARRWNIFFKILFFAYLAPFLLIFLGWWSPGEHKAGQAGRHTAMVDIKGVIESDGEASAEAINAALRLAFEDVKTAGIVLRLNTPGGSPVQAGIVHDEIKRLRALHPDTPVYAVVEEICASGGYYIAAAADRIYVDKASMVGSIGVLMDGFGFVGAMDKVGVERRLLTAGRNKGFLDSFSPMNDEHRQIAQKMLSEIHQQFIEVVKAGRGARLKDSPDLFTGQVWSGARSIELGLADALGSVEGVARDVIKAEDIVDFSTHENLAERLAKRIGAAAGQTLAGTLSAAGVTPRLR